MWVIRHQCWANCPLVFKWSYSQIFWTVDSTASASSVGASASSSVVGKIHPQCIASSIVVVMRQVNCPQEMGTPIASNTGGSNAPLHSPDPSQCVSTDILLVPAIFHRLFSKFPRATPHFKSIISQIEIETKLINFCLDKSNWSNFIIKTEQINLYKIG